MHNEQHCCKLPPERDTCWITYISIKKKKEKEKEINSWGFIQWEEGIVLKAVVPGESLAAEKIERRKKLKG